MRPSFFLVAATVRSQAIIERLRAPAAFSVAAQRKRFTAPDFSVSSRDDAARTTVRVRRPLPRISCKAMQFFHGASA
jgi:hypothetical protein